SSLTYLAQARRAAEFTFTPLLPSLKQRMTPAPHRGCFFRSEWYTSPLAAWSRRGLGLCGKGRFKSPFAAHADASTGIPSGPSNTRQEQFRSDALVHRR